MPRPLSLPAEVEVRETETRALKRRRRPRSAVACDSCRTRKVKCDGGFPCSSCIQHSFDCAYKDRQPRIIHVQDNHSLDLSTRTNENVEPQTMPLPGVAESPALQPTSPVSLGDGAVSEPVAPATSTNQGSNVEALAPSEEAASGLGAVNQHTGGSEFYGPSGTFYFLSRLRFHAKSRPRSWHLQNTAAGVDIDSSVVNLLHSSDYPLKNAQDASASNQHGPSPSPAQAQRPVLESLTLRPTSRNDESLKDIETEIQRECVRLYFENLHCVHPILDHTNFLGRCERELWLDREPDNSTPASKQGQGKQRFLALFNVVLAIGAITAGETSLLTWDRTTKFLEHGSSNDVFSNPPSYTPIRVARLYFEKTRTLLGDIFESSSIETTQTLFLMSVFCQNALKPHSCYMYSGMALRTAFAIGLPTTSEQCGSEKSRLWWAMYSFEIEMCSSAGRQSFLQAPKHYGIPLPSSTTLEPLLPFINCMVDLAGILAEVAANGSPPCQDESLVAKSNKSMNLERSLKEWKEGLPNDLDFSTSSLRENELITKQKVVLRLRYLNMKILIHRPFLLSVSIGQDPSLSNHVSSCVDAARETIRFVWDTYLYRPYFRTWWYNCTYVLDATMALLYVVLMNICPCPVEAILGDIDKSLEIFSSMKILAVARRYTDITREVLNTAKKAHAESHLQALGKDSQHVLGPHDTQLGDMVETGPSDDQGGRDRDIGGDGLTYEELYSTLVDTNLVYNFLNFEDWNAWTTADGGGAETGNFLY
ncbi:hypothetical protein ACJZ2D_012846 [Fusarium nematophilum]